MKIKRKVQTIEFWIASILLFIVSLSIYSTFQVVKEIDDCGGIAKCAGKTVKEFKEGMK